MFRHTGNLSTQERQEGFEVETSLEFILRKLVSDKNKTHGEQMYEIFQDRFSLLPLRRTSRILGLQ